MGKGSQLLGARQNLVWDSDGPNSIEFEDQSSAMVYIHTLAQYTAEGSGRHAMSSLKRMTGTASFEQLPDEQKKCHIHNREECHTQKYLDQVKSKCGCLPWALASKNSKNQVKTDQAEHIFPFLTGKSLLWSRDGKLHWKPNF